MLTGPAAIGFLSKEIGLRNAFWFLAALLSCVLIFGTYMSLGRIHEINEKLPRL
jgi:hypothetical protein